MVDVAKEDHLTVQQRLVTEHVAQVQARLKGARPQTDPKASIKSRWWKIPAINLNFGILSTNEVFWYKWNVRFNVKYFSHLSSHLKSKSHLESSWCWYLSMSAIPKIVFFPMFDREPPTLSENRTEDDIVTLKYNIFENRKRSSRKGTTHQKYRSLKSKWLGGIFDVCNNFRDVKSMKQFEKWCSIFDKNYAELSRSSNKNDTIEVVVKKDSSKTFNLHLSALKKRDAKFFDKKLDEVSMFHDYFLSNKGETGKVRYPELFERFMKFKRQHSQYSLQEWYDMYRGELKESVARGDISASWANQIISAMLFYARKIICDQTLNIATLPKQIAERTPVLSKEWRSTAKLNKIYGRLLAYKSIPTWFWVWVTTGIRGHEYVKMKRKHASILTERGDKMLKFTFIGKGAKKGEVITYDRRWIAIVEKAIEDKKDDDFIFTSDKLSCVCRSKPTYTISKSGKKGAHAIFDRRVNSIVKDLSTRMKLYIHKITGEEVPLHGLRRTYATVLYESKTSLETISKLLRHSSLEETLKYIDVEAINETLKNEIKKSTGRLSKTRMNQRNKK